MGSAVSSTVVVMVHIVRKALPAVANGLINAVLCSEPEFFLKVPDLQPKVAKGRPLWGVSRFVLILGISQVVGFVGPCLLLYGRHPRKIMPALGLGEDPTTFFPEFETAGGSRTSMDL